jgi:hypothetical protein
VHPAGSLQDARSAGVSVNVTARRSPAFRCAGVPAPRCRPRPGRQDFTIGLLLDNIRNPFYGDFLDGVTDALAKTDFQVLVGSAGFGAQNQ